MYFRISQDHLCLYRVAVFSSKLIPFSVVDISKALAARLDALWLKMEAHRNNTTLMTKTECEVCVNDSEMSKQQVNCYIYFENKTAVRQITRK